MGPPQTSDSRCDGLPYHMHNTSRWLWVWCCRWQQSVQHWQMSVTCANCLSDRLDLESNQQPFNNKLFLQVQLGAPFPHNRQGAVASTVVAVACLLAASGFQQGNQHPVSTVQKHMCSVLLQLQQQGAEGEAGAAAVSSKAEGPQGAQADVQEGASADSSAASGWSC